MRGPPYAVPLNGMRRRRDLGIVEAMVEVLVGDM